MITKKAFREVNTFELKLGMTIPTFTLLIILGLLPLFKSGIDHRATYYLFLPALLTALWLLINRKSALHRDDVLPFLFYGLLILWSAISIFWSITPHRTMLEFLQLSIYGTVMFLATYISYDGYYRIGRIVLIAGVLLVVHGILQSLLLGATTVTSTFHHHNPFGIYMVVLFFCAWGYYLKHQTKTTAFAATIFLIGLFISGSRGSLVALILALPLLLTAIPLNRQSIINNAVKTVACLLIAFIIASIIISIPPLQIDKDVEEQLAGILGRPDYLASQNIFARFAYWEVGYNLIQAKPILGYGLGTFFSAYALIDTWPSMHYARLAHNHYLQVFVETGLVGFLLFLSFIGSVLIILLKKKQALTKLSPIYPGALSAILAYLIHIGIDFTWNMPSVTVPFFFLLGILLGHRNHQMQDSNEKTPSYFRDTRTSGRYILILSILILLFLNSWYLIAFYYYNQAIRMEVAGNHEEAAQIYNHVNTIYPINGRAYNLSAENKLELYRLTGEELYLQKALEDSDLAVALNPYDPLINLTRSYILRYLGEDKAAYEELYYNYKYSGDYIVRYVNAAMLHMQREKLNAAKNSALKGLEHSDYVLQITYGSDNYEDMQKAFADAHLILVDIFKIEGDYAQAEQHLRHVEDIMPDHPDLIDR